MIEHTWKYLQETSDIEDCLCTVCGYRRTYRRISETGWQADPFTQLTSCPGPQEDWITFPRAVAVALVTAASSVSVCAGEDWAEALCSVCSTTVGSIGDVAHRVSIPAIHAEDCPVRIVQEALANYQPS